MPSHSLQHDDVVIVRDVHGDEERMRYLWPAHTGHVWCKSLTKPHAKMRKVQLCKIIRNEGRHAVADNALWVESGEPT